MSKRSSARLAKAKGRGEIETTGTHDHNHDTESQHHESGEEEVQPPPRKRQRAATKATKAPTRKKPLAGTRGLATLADMPLDILVELAVYLLPIDIISLARLNKSIRSMLMHRSSIHVWHAARRNVEGLPDCPPDMSEPRFVSLIFSKTCSACGEPARVKLDEILRARLCGPCRTEHLVHYADVPQKLQGLLRTSSSAALSKSRATAYFVLREDLDAIKAEYEHLVESKDTKSLKEWTKEKQEMVDRRRKETNILTHFFEGMQTGRQKEQAQTSKARWSEIQRRLRAAGWDGKDMDFTKSWSTKRKEWRALVIQPKPITDRVWANLTPKLIPLLEINRKERLRVESEERQRARADRLHGLMRSMKHREFSALEFEVKLQPRPPLDAVLTSTVTYQAPFPSFNQTLKWSVFQSLYETDSTVAEMEETFKEHREEIKAHITEWQSGIHGYFLGLLRQGNSLQPTTGIPDPSPDLSDDLKLLLRADVLFLNTSAFYFERKTPLTYDALSPRGEMILSYGYQSYWNSNSGALPDLRHIVLYAEAQEVARTLLADMGIPNASCLEMKVYESNLVCGRCHDTGHKSWAELVQHYVQANELYAAVQTDSASLSETGITYNNVHDPAQTELPMVIHTPTRVVHAQSGTKSHRLCVCVLCEKLPVKNRVVIRKSPVLQHLRDVHGIVDPMTGEHYRQHDTLGCGPPGTEDSDSDDGTAKKE